MDNEEVYSIKVEEFRMKKSTVIKLLAILMTVCMLLSFIACDKEGSKAPETQGQASAEKTEAVTDAPETEPADEESKQDETEPRPTESEKETATEESESNDAPAESESQPLPETEPETDPETEPEPDRDCEHEWGEEVAADGKHVKTCTLCGEEKSSNKHTYVTQEKGVSHICECGATKYCPSVLKSNETGHWKAACDICGVEAEEKAAHTSPTLELVTENGTESYQYSCSYCGYKVRDFKLSSDVNYYISAGQFATSAWQSSTDGEIYLDGDVVYQRFSVTHHGGTIPLVHSGNVTDEYTVDIKGGSGNYFVFKIKTTNADALSWRITAKKDGEVAAKPSGAYPALRAEMPEGEWTVYVVDIAALIKAGNITTYGTAGDRDVTKFAAAFMYGYDGRGAEEGTYLDIAYFAVCDTWEEVEGVVGDEYVIYTDWKNSEGDQKLSSDGALPVITKGEEATKVIYKKTGEKLQIFVRSPYSETYTRYDFFHIVKENINYDSWKLISIEICDSDLKKLYNTATDDQTECEGALQERYPDGTLAADFVGGFHGDEKIKKITVIVDGVELDMSKDYGLTACESVQTIVESIIYRCDTTEQVFDRVRTNTWTKDGVEIKNKYTATAKIKIYRPETAMLAIAIDNDGYNGLITEHWDNVHNEWTEIGDFYASEGRYSAAGMTEARMRGLLDVCVRAYDCTFNGETLSPRGHFSYNYFSDTNRRIKIYLAPFYDRQFEVGDVFESTTFQSVFATE